MYIRYPETKPTLPEVQHLERLCLYCRYAASALYTEYVYCPADTDYRVMADDFTAIAQSIENYVLDWGYGLSTEHESTTVQEAFMRLRDELNPENPEPWFNEYYYVHEIIEFRVDSYTRTHEF